ncbi:MAG: trigger factor [Candidatus Paceibacterota bacterium]|nr:MAG: trigger factor [Candidatus Paceibacterota bacterium]
MEYTKTKDVDFVRTYEVTLSTEDVAQHVKMVRDEHRAHAAQDGFRPGMAPVDSLDARTLEAIREAGAERAVRASLDELAQKEGMRIASVRSIEVQKKTDEGVSFSVEVGTYPPYTLPALDSIQVTEKAVSVSDADVARAIEQLRRSRATFTPKKDDPAALGDRVVVDFSVRHAEKIIEGGEQKAYPLILGSNTMIPGFEEKLVGARAGEERAFSLAVPADFGNDAIAGKELSIHATVKEVDSVMMPELSDEFAASLGNFPSASALEGRVREGLLQEAKEKERQRVRLAILDGIMNASSVPAPAFLVDEQLDSMIAGFDQDLHERGLELSMYLAQLKQTQDDLRAQWRPAAMRQAQIALVLQAVAEQHGVRLEEQEVQEALTRAVQEALARGFAKDASAIDLVSLRARIAPSLLRERTFAFLEERCVERA